jgi:hypothetical protein
MYQMIKYLIIHNKHEGCYDFQCYQDEVARIRLTSIRINPPKIFMFSTRDEAQDFFEEYINDIDCIDIRCKRGEDVEHIDYCTCGVIELDDKGEPILFYNKKNQIFLMEHGPQIFVPNYELKNDIKHYNLTNRLIRKCKSLGREQRKRYIELGKYCEECNASNSDSDEETDKNVVICDQNNIQNENVKNDIDEYHEFDKDSASEIKVLKSIPQQGITLEALTNKIGIYDVKEGMDICLRNKWIYKDGNLIMKTTTEMLNNEIAKKNELNKQNETNIIESKCELTETSEVKKSRAPRKKKNELTETPEADIIKTNGEEKLVKEKKPRAPRKKKTEI